MVVLESLKKSEGALCSCLSGVLDSPLEVQLWESAFLAGRGVAACQ